jgi:hypothetical protein
VEAIDGDGWKSLDYLPQTDVTLDRNNETQPDPKQLHTSWLREWCDVAHQNWDIRQIVFVASEGESLVLSWPSQYGQLGSNPNEYTSRGDQR